MRRFVIFALLGPILGFMTFMALLYALNFVLDGSTRFQFTQVVLIPLAYALGIVPALITAGFDYVIRRARYRVLWTTVFGYFAGFMPVMSAFLAGFIHGPYVFAIGMVGLVPGAICSWLAGKQTGGNTLSGKQQAET